MPSGSKALTNNDKFSFRRANNYASSRSRRDALVLATKISLATSAATFMSVNAWANELVHTAQTSEGPLYPDKMPIDTDNDLLLVNGATLPGTGEILHLSGRIVDAMGSPLRNAFVEIWQCDAMGIYRHSRHEKQSGGKFDRNFQGYGRFLTDVDGLYYFRTIKPVPYTFQGADRAPHIHFAISRNGARIFTTEMSIKDHPKNVKDRIINRLTEEQLATVQVNYKTLPGSQLAEVTATFNIAIGTTSDDTDAKAIRGGISKSTWQTL